MTQRQILLHYGALQRMRRRARAELLVDVNKAFCGGKGADQHMRQLLDR